MNLITSRLEILPLNSAQMKLLLQGTSFLEQKLQLSPSGLELDPHTHDAMRYIDELASKTPDAYPWITNWQIILKAERISIGSACFMNVPNESGAVEIGYGIYPEYQRKGFMTEALNAICSWALNQDRVKMVTAQSEPKNIPSHRVLEKCGFINNSAGEWIRNKMEFKIISLRNNPDHLQLFLDFFIRHWHNEAVYRDCMTACLCSISPLPQWYLLVNQADEIIGGAGLITNDFISRMDLWPWLCALYIEEPYRGKAYGKELIEHVRKEAKRLGFDHLYLCTDHIGYYEKYGFQYFGDGHHPWGESSRIYHNSTEE